MSVVRTIEIDAESPDGLEQAIASGVAQAAAMGAVESAWVKDIKVDVADNGIRGWRVHMLVTAPAEPTPAPHRAQSDPTGANPEARVGDGGGIIPPASS